MRDFPADARRQAGFELDAVQRGLEPSDWKPMTSVGTRVREIRTRREDIELALRRYRQTGA